MASILNAIIRFGSKTECVRHEAHYNVSPADAFEICKDYAEFIKVMLQGQKSPPNPKWIQLGPGEVGGQVRYLLEREGSPNTIIVEEVTELNIDEDTGVHTLAWEQVSSHPQLPLKDYGCRWMVQPTYDAEKLPSTHLIWTRHFKQPLLFGIISLTNFMKGSFRRTSIGIMNFVFRQFYAAEFPPSDRRLPKKEDRVVIIGAGPSGLHMAHLLKNKVGVTDITILEQSDRYGGKTLTVKDETQKGVVHELGTCYMHPAYFAVRAYMQELKNMPGCNLPGFAEEVEPINYSINRPGKSAVNLEQWVTSNLQVQPRFSVMAVLRIMLPKLDTGIELYYATMRYNQLHREIFGPYDYSMPPRLSPENLAKLDMSFGQFLQEHDLTALTPILAYGNTAQGYGSIQNVPAFWAMCWITPQLLSGYFPILPGALPKKVMFKIGWLSMWDMTVKLNDLNIKLNTSVDNIKRTEDGPIIITGSQLDADGNPEEFVQEYDYLVVAAPLLDPTDTTKQVPLDLTQEEAHLLRSKTLTNSQFRTILFRLNQPKPYLDYHLDVDATKLLGPDTGKGDVFASRDSYLALHPQYCSLEENVNDPARGELREQMAYQWVDNDKDVPLEVFEEKIDTWLMEQFGDEKNYKYRQDKLWDYFQRYDRDGLNEFMPWKVLELQGRNRTLFVHASTFFESVLDIVNYNNMLVDGLSGKLNMLTHPESDKKPLYFESDHWKLFYNKLTKFALSFFNIIIGTVWTLLYIPIRPILAATLIRWQRKRLQTAFKTKDLGPWYKFDMKQFLKVSPNLASLVSGEEDPIVTHSKKKLAKEYPEIPIVDNALKWSYSDYRVAVNYWMDEINPTLLSFIGPKTASFIRSCRLMFPVTINYLSSWGFALSFNLLTGYSRRKEDDRGGGCYVPKCEMLDVARKEYGEELGCRVCTHICKIFTEEAMKRKGIDCSFEPNFDKGSCMIRGVPFQGPAYMDHSVNYGLAITPEGTELDEAQIVTVQEASHG